MVDKSRARFVKKSFWKDFFSFSWSSTTELLVRCLIGSLPIHQVVLTKVLFLLWHNSFDVKRRWTSSSHRWTSSESNQSPLFFLWEKERSVKCGWNNSFGQAVGPLRNMANQPMTTYLTCSGRPNVFCRTVLFAWNLTYSSRLSSQHFTNKSFQNG